MARKKLPRVFYSRQGMEAYKAKHLRPVACSPKGVPIYDHEEARSLNIELREPGEKMAWLERRMAPRGRPMSAYAKMAGGKITRTEEIAPEVFADFDGKGNVVGIEVLGKIEEMRLFEMLDSVTQPREARSQTTGAKDRPKTAATNGLGVRRSRSWDL